jgi:hypothetical protein
MTYTDESMDRAIDEVARAMTTAPSPALRARVAARLRPRASRHPSWLTPAAVMLVTAAVAVLLVTRRVTLRHVTSASPAATSSASVSEPATTSPPSASLSPVANRPRVAAVNTATNGDAQTSSGLDRVVPALAAAPDLTIPTIQPTALPIAQLEVAPIAPAEPLVVRAIGRDR